MTMNRLDGAKQNVVGADAHHLADTAVKRNQRLFQLRASGHTRLPAGGGKAVFHGRFAAKKV